MNMDVKRSNETLFENCSCLFLGWDDQNHLLFYVGSLFYQNKHVDFPFLNVSQIMHLDILIFFSFKKTDPHITNQICTCACRKTIMQAFFPTTICQVSCFRQFSLSHGSSNTDKQCSFHYNCDISLFWSYFIFLQM